MTSLLFAIHIGAQENTVHKKEVGLTKNDNFNISLPEKSILETTTLSNEFC